MAFLEGASGNPKNSKRRLTSHEALNISDFNAYRDGLMFGGVVGIEKAQVAAQKILVGGVPAAKLDGKARVPNFTINFGDVDPADRSFLHLLANLMEKYKVTDNTTWRLFDFALTGLTAPTSADSYLELGEDTDVLPRMRVLNMLVGGLSIAGAVDGNFSADFACVASRFDFWGAPVQIEGSSPFASDLPTILGDYSLSAGADDQWDGDFTDSLFVTITAISSGVWTLKAEFDAAGGGAPAFGSNTFSYVAGSSGGARMVLSSTGVGIGDFSRPILFAMAGDASVEVGDTWEIPIRRAAWTPSLPTLRAIPMVGTQVYKSGELIATEGGWNLDATWGTTEIVSDPSQEQGGTPRRRGELAVTVTPTREIVDLDLQASLARKETLSIVIEGRTNALISGAARPWLIRFIMPACTVSGTSYGTATGGDATTEQVTLTAGVPDAAFEFPVGSGRMYSSHLHIVVETDAPAAL